jgi:hypothetical protein
MDFLKLDERIMELIDREKFGAAEAELHEAKLQASNAADHQALDHVLSLLVTLSSVKQPPDLSKAEAYLLGTRAGHRHGLCEGSIRDDIVLGDGCPRPHRR